MKKEGEKQIDTVEENIVYEKKKPESIDGLSDSQSQKFEAFLEYVIVFIFTYSIFF